MLPLRLVGWVCAGLMLLPVYLGLCGLDDVHVSQRAAAELVLANAGVAVVVGLVHSLAMIGGGGVQPSIVRRNDGLLVSWFRDNGSAPKRVLRSES